MPSAKTHFIIGFVAFVLAAAGLFYLQQPLNGNFLVVGLFFSLFFSQLPDLDEHDSKISQLVGKILIAAAIISFIIYYSSKENLFFIAGIGLLVLMFVIRELKHRGIMHSYEIAIAFCAIVALFLGLHIALFAFAGIFSHLFADGAYGKYL